MKTRRVIVAVAVCGLFALSACSDKSTDDGGSSGKDVKTDFGVTGSTITLGALSDLSGPFQELDKGVAAGHEIWVDEVNKNGGICGRDIKVEVRDHGYKADAAVVAYSEIGADVLGWLEVLGSPINAAVDPKLVQDKSTAIALSWSSFILTNPYVIIPGTTYDIEMINGLSYLLKEGKIKEGDTVGDIYIEGEYGENGLLGAKYFAKQHDITLKPVKIVATDTDMRNIVTGFKGDAVDAIAMTTTPAQTLSAATVNKQLGLNVPIVGNNPIYAPSTLTKDSAEALSNVYVVASGAPYSADVPAAKKVRDAFEAGSYEVEPSYGVTYGYANGLIWQQILEKACDNGDMTRVGVNKALQESTITTENLIADLDFSKVGTPATREVYIGVPDLDEPGKLRQTGPLFVSDDAKSYVAPNEK